MYTAAASDRRIVVIGKAHDWSPQMLFFVISAGPVALRGREAIQTVYIYLFIPVYSIYIYTYIYIYACVCVLYVFCFLSTDVTLLVRGGTGCGSLHDIYVCVWVNIYLFIYLFI